MIPPRSRRRVPIPAALRDHLVERRLEAAGETYVFGGAREARKMAERGSAAIKAAGVGAERARRAPPVQF